MYMKKYLVLLASLFLLGFSVLGQKRERQVVARLNDYFVTLETGYTTVKDRCKVERVKIDTKRRKLTIYVNELFTGQTFNRDKVDKIYKDVKRTLYSPYNKYKIEILGKNVSLESLINNVNEHENSNRRYSKKLLGSQVWARNDNRPFPSVCQPTEQKFVGVAERKELLRHIDCYGVHAYNLQRERPTAPASHIYKVVEECEHRKAVSAHHQYE